MAHPPTAPADDDSAAVAEADAPPASAGDAQEAQRWSRRAVDLMHLPDGPEIAPRDDLFRELYTELAWIHAHDAHAVTLAGVAAWTRRTATS